MKNKLIFDDALYQYMISISLRESDACRRLREETEKLAVPQMHIQPEQGQFLAFLVRLMGAKRVLEIGTFTGVSACWLAEAMPEDGRIITCDINDDWMATAKQHWERAGIAKKITAYLQPATETLTALIAEQSPLFDFIFVDADKANYLTYFEQGLQLLRPEGVMVFDNVFRAGRVIAPNPQPRNVKAIRSFNEALHHDERIALSTVPIGDGITLVMKR